MSSEKTGWDYAYVGAQFGLFILYLIGISVWHFKVIRVLLYLGLTVAIFGGVMFYVAVYQLKMHNLTAYPTPKKGGTLIQNGLYKYIRHPIYTSIILIGIGWSTVFGSGLGFIITAMMTVLFYFKSRYEEIRLREQFPQYEQYQESTGRLFPKIW